MTFRTSLLALVLAVSVVCPALARQSTVMRYDAPAPSWEETPSGFSGIITALLW